MRSGPGSWVESSSPEMHKCRADCAIGRDGGAVLLLHRIQIVVPPALSFVEALITLPVLWVPDFRCEVPCLIIALKIMSSLRAHASNPNFLALPT